MENRLLKAQQKAAIYYARENDQYRKIKTNITLVIAIVSICLAVRLNEKGKLLNVGENTNNSYFDAPPHQTISFLNIAKLV